MREGGEGDLVGGERRGVRKGGEGELVGVDIESIMVSTLTRTLDRAVCVSRGRRWPKAVA